MPIGFHTAQRSSVNRASRERVSELVELCAGVNDDFSVDATPVSARPLAQYDADHDAAAAGTPACQ